MNENYGQDQHPWQLSEKMVLGALLLEGDNYEFWVALGCLSGYNALRQHALIRGLQLDVSLAVAWAYLGKLYREEGEKSLARLAFDCSRSIDPSLSLPWAGMSADSQIRDMTPEEAFESCSRAAQILPVAEFQVGLAKLALISGSLMSSQVFGAIRQAVQKAPHYPETHNLHGLVCEARSEYQAAITSFRLARCAIISSGDTSKSCLQDIAVNLARSLSKAGYAADAVQECESLRKEGMLDSEGLQIYAFCLWQLGENDHALSVVRNLASSVSAMERAFAAASVSFICRMLYYISGLDLAVSSILKMPKEFLQSTKVWIVASAIHALDHSNRLALGVSSSQYSLLSHDEIIEKHYLTALANLVKHGSDYCLGFQSGISHVKNALHSYPNSNLLRNLLGHLLLSCEEWKETHVASRCCITEAPNCASKQGLKSGCEILGAGAVACYAIGNVDPKFSYPACGYQCLNGPGAVQELQKYMHQEPWNHRAQYLLILNLLQKAREERFPSNICVILERLILVALSNEFYSRESMSYQYQKFQLLLCASEISLQGGNIAGCIKHAKNASSLTIPNNYLFFGHLLLCRAYAAVDDYTNLQQQYIRCLELETDYHIGWVCLKIIESLYNVESDSKISVLSFKKCSKEWKKSLNMWIAVFNLVLGLIYLWKEEYFSAEESIAQACSLASSESCLFLCHGVACVRLARQFCSSDYLSLAVNSLTSAHANSVIPLPIVSLLLAQAEGSLGLKQNWEKNLRLEWYSWPPEMRPAELFFQMHLLSIQSESGFKTPSRVEFCQSSLKWVLRAIHTNPSSLRYWNILHKLME
ncbi:TETRATRICOPEPTIDE REPEAT PROTEIN 37 [Salix purpurea]|uniref:TETRATRICOPEPTIDE REPEAT PROTEIN 37 n=1 Tax=Salix purpurea TaxID=77065 RepID=A0A9Q0SPP5_SALPP|nr:TETRATRICOPEPTIDE REPEAT PROTEIN 37 [Salix purpurea]